MTLSLTNKLRRCQVFVLAHETYCAARGACACAVQPGREGRRIARSLILPSGATLSDLEDAVLAVPAIGHATRSDEVAVKRHVALPARVTTPVAPSAEASPREGTKKKRGG